MKKTTANQSSRNGKAGRKHTKGVILTILCALFFIGLYQGVKDSGIVRSSEDRARLDQALHGARASAAQSVPLAAAQPTARPTARPTAQPTTRPTAAAGAPFTVKNTSRNLERDIQGHWSMLGETNRKGEFKSYSGYVGDILMTAEWWLDGETVSFVQLQDGEVTLRLNERYTITDDTFYNHDSLFVGTVSIDGDRMIVEASGYTIYYQRVR